MYAYSVHFQYCLCFLCVCASFLCLNAYKIFSVYTHTFQCLLFYTPSHRGDHCCRRKAWTYWGSSPISDNGARLLFCRCAGRMYRSELITHTWSVRSRTYRWIADLLLEGQMVAFADLVRGQTCTSSVTTHTKFMSNVCYIIFKWNRALPLLRALRLM